MVVLPGQIMGISYVFSQMAISPQPPAIFSDLMMLVTPGTPKSMLREKLESSGSITLGLLKTYTFNALFHLFSPT